MTTTAVAAGHVVSTVAFEPAGVFFREHPVGPGELRAQVQHLGEHWIHGKHNGIQVCHNTRSGVLYAEDYHHERGPQVALLAAYVEPHVLRQALEEFRDRRSIRLQELVRRLRRSS